MRKLFSIIAIWIALTAISNSKPNIIFINIDDIGADIITSYGADEELYPNLERLATDGVTFNRAYAFHLCAPSRGVWRTGRNPRRNGVQHVIAQTYHLDPEQEVSIFKVMKEAGYRTGMVGKWHNFVVAEHYPPDETDPGWIAASNQHMEDHGIDYHYVYEGAAPSAYIGNYGDPTVKENFLPWKLMNAVTNFISESVDLQQPFFIEYAQALVHSPYTKTPDNLSDGQTNLQLIRGMASYSDKMIGAVIDHCEALGIMENTLILACGDNGTETQFYFYNQGVFLQGTKGVSSAAQNDVERSLRIPMFVRWDGVLDAGSTYEEMVHIADLPITFAELGGATFPNDRVYDGMSFWRSLTTGGAHRRNFHTHMDGSMQVDGLFGRDYRLTDNEDGTFTLYKLNFPLGETEVTSPTLAEANLKLAMIHEYNNHTNRTAGVGWNGLESEKILYQSN